LEEDGDKNDEILEDILSTLKEMKKSQLKFKRKIDKRLKIENHSNDKKLQIQWKLEELKYFESLWGESENEILNKMKHMFPKKSNRNIKSLIKHFQEANLTPKDIKNLSDILEKTNTTFSSPDDSLLGDTLTLEDQSSESF